MKRRKEKKT